MTENLSKTGNNMIVYIRDDCGDTREAVARTCAAFLSVSNGTTEPRLNCIHRIQSPNYPARSTRPYDPAGSPKAESPPPKNSQNRSGDRYSDRHAIGDRYSEQVFFYKQV
jgi:hypothetical protein